MVMGNLRFDDYREGDWQGPCSAKVINGTTGEIVATVHGKTRELAVDRAVTIQLMLQVADRMDGLFGSKDH